MSQQKPDLQLKTVPKEKKADSMQEVSKMFFFFLAVPVFTLLIAVKMQTHFLGGLPVYKSEGK